jgi:hypothetical protein
MPLGRQAAARAAAAMQKPAAQDCGRVFSKTFDFDQNTIRDRTSQSKLGLVLHSLRDRRHVSNGAGRGKRHCGVVFTPSRSS